MFYLQRNNISTSSTSSNNKKSKLKLVRNNPRYKCLEKRMTIKPKSAFMKKNWHRDYTSDFFEGFKI